MFNIDFGSKRAQSTIRIATYTISTVFVVGFTIALVLATLGYDIDRNTGQVIQNGLVLVNSEPEGATVSIDGQPERDNTPGRFSLPEGVHDISVSLDGYQDWFKTVSVQGSEVVWLYYPLLIPNDITPSAVTTVKDVEFISAVPDGQRMLIRAAQDAPNFRLATVSKTSITNEEVLRVPSDIFTLRNDSVGTFKFAGWASGDDYFLVEHRNGRTVEFVLVNVNNPEESQNLTDIFDLPLRSVRFIDDNHERMYALVNRDLRRLDLSNQTISTPIVRQVNRYVLHTDRFVVYVTSTGENSSELGLIEGSNEPRILEQFTQPANNYRIEFAEFDRQFHLSVLDIESSTMTVRFNPHTDDGENPIVIREPGARYLSFSRNGRFVMIQSTNKFSLYDFDEEQRYSFASELELEPQAVEWLDGHHLLLHDTDGQMHITEFDGANTRQVGTADPDFDVILSDSQNVIYSVSSPTRTGVSIINGLDLIVN